MRKSQFNDEFLVLLGPIISRFFACSKEEKINQNNIGCVLLSYLYAYCAKLSRLKIFVDKNTLTYVVGEPMT
jgi:hypothetical protein